MIDAGLLAFAGAVAAVISVFWSQRRRSNSPEARGTPAERESGASGRDGSAADHSTSKASAAAVGSRHEELSGPHAPPIPAANGSAPDGDRRPGAAALTTTEDNQREGARRRTKRGGRRRRKKKGGGNEQAVVLLDETPRRLEPPPALAPGAFSLWDLPPELVRIVASYHFAPPIVFDDGIARRELGPKTDEWLRCAPALVVACPQGDVRRALRGDLDTAEKSRCNTVGPLPAMTIRQAENLLRAWGKRAKLATREGAGWLLVEELHSYMARFLDEPAERVTTLCFMHRVNALLMYGADPNIMYEKPVGKWLAALHMTSQMGATKTSDGCLVAHALLMSGADPHIRTRGFDYQMSLLESTMDSLSQIVNSDGPPTRDPVELFLSFVPPSCDLLSVVIEFGVDLTAREYESLVAIIHRGVSFIQFEWEIDPDQLSPWVFEVRDKFKRLYILLRLQQESREKWDDLVKLASAEFDEF